VATTSAAATLSSTGRLEPEAAGARLSELFARHGATVLGLCRLLLRHREEAEDAVQQTFLSAYRGLLNGVEPRHPAAWLATIARNECRSRIEVRMREPLGDDEPPSTLPDPVAAAAAKADLDELWRAIGELPRQQRSALLLREFSGLSYVELASALAISEPAVESLLFRARRELRVRLKPAYGSVTGLVPLSAIREALARAIGGMPDPATTGVLAKIGAAPLVAKLAAGAAVVVVAGGTVAAVENPSLRGPAPAFAEPAAGQTSGAGPPAQGRPSVVGGMSVAGTAKRLRAAVIRAQSPRHRPALMPVSAAARPQAASAPANDPAPTETIPIATVTLAADPEPPGASDPPVSTGVQPNSSVGEPQPAGDTGSIPGPGSDELGGEETSSPGSDEPSDDGSGSSAEDESSGSSGSGDTAGSGSGEDGSGDGGSGDSEPGSDTINSGHGEAEPGDGGVSPEPALPTPAPQ
jgi:RNA polymerase sigma-70 factor (ECF subfamily)